MDTQLTLERLKEYSTPQRPLYLVGGAVRDILLNRPVHDLDFVVSGPTRKLAQEVACVLDGALYVLDEERDTTRVVLNVNGPERLLLDFATLRAENLEGDLRGRDFTINAMAFNVSDPARLIDPLGGFVDLREKRIRACSPTSLQEDPARVLRAVRQALSLHFLIDPKTQRLIRAAAPLLARVSPERQRDELFKMLGGSQVSLAVQVLDQLGVLQFVLPELESLKQVTQSAPHVSNVWEHTLSTVQYLGQLLDALLRVDQEDSPDLINSLAVTRLGRYREHFTRHFQEQPQYDRSPRSLFFLAALYHDIAKPRTRAEEPGGKVCFLGHPELGANLTVHRARALALSNQEVERVQTIVEQHMRVHFLVSSLHALDDVPSRRAIYRFFRETGETGVEICLLSLADMRATYGVTLPQEQWLAEINVCRALLEAYWEQSEEVVSPPRYLSGNDLMDELNLKPGPMLGKLLEAIREAQAAGEIPNREEALSFARAWLNQAGSP